MALLVERGRLFVSGNSYSYLLRVLGVMILLLALMMLYQGVQLVSESETFVVLLLVPMGTS